MMTFIKKYKPEILLVFFIFLTLVFTHMNTFIANDDIPYSLYFRTSNRVTSIFGIMKNQIFDYSHISSRIIIHSVVQFLLMFGKNLWSILNPLCIVIFIVYACKLSLLFNNDKKNVNYILIIISTVLYLLLFSYKRIIYWVAGSVNYVWPGTLLMIILYYYYKYGFCKYKLVNTFVIFFLSMLCECTMVFMITFVIGNFIIEWYQKKKINSDYFFYFLGLLGSLIILLSPSTGLRMSADDIWNNLSLFDKLNLTIPVISHNLLDFKNYLNVLPYLFIMAMIFKMFYFKIRYSILLTLLITIIYALIMIFNIEWLYFVLVIILVLTEFFICIKTKKLSYFVMALSFYAVVYFNIFTPLYWASRPNYFFYCYMIIYILQLLSLINCKNVVIKLFFFIIFGYLVANELIVYYNIGSIYQNRLKNIEKCRNDRCHNLVLRKIPDKYDIYHMDINLPDRGYFTYQPFIDYYGLSNDIVIEYK